MVTYNLAHLRKVKRSYEYTRRKLQIGVKVSIGSGKKDMSKNRDEKKIIGTRNFANGLESNNQEFLPKCPLLDFNLCKKYLKDLLKNTQQNTTWYI